MNTVWRNLGELHRDQAGQTSLEWVMVLVAFGIPLITLFKLASDALAAHYSRITFFQSLPFP